MLKMFIFIVVLFFFFFKQKTAYEMRISDWSSDVCSSDLRAPRTAPPRHCRSPLRQCRPPIPAACPLRSSSDHPSMMVLFQICHIDNFYVIPMMRTGADADCSGASVPDPPASAGDRKAPYRSVQPGRSEEHTSELQSLIGKSYAVF